ncbi:MAG: hypothetical protein WKF84_02340 [Pyrinomonadaceae bacterium]
MITSMRGEKCVGKFIEGKPRAQAFSQPGACLTAPVYVNYLARQIHIALTIDHL